MTEDLRRQAEAALGHRYDVLRELGSGGMGTVLLADDLKHGRKVAIKVLAPDVGSRIGRERFLREIDIVAGLNHPHIVPLHDSGEAGGLLYYVMPWIDGPSLKQLLADSGPLPVQEALRLVREVADALRYAHARGVIHRDVKPSNILISGGHALLADFGIARSVDTAEGADRTRSGTVLGTPLYMSPEQITAEGEIDHRSDLYSLGCVLFETLAGRAPFAARTTPALMAGHVRGAIPPIRRFRKEVPRSVASLLERALAKTPEGRLPDAEAFLQALVRSEASGGERLRHGRALVIVGTTGVLTLAAAVVVQRLRPGGLQDRTGSVVVLPFADDITSPRERTLLIDLAGEITRQLDQWDSVRAVPQISLAGVAFDLGHKGPVYLRADDGLALARAVGVDRMLSLTLRLRGDSAAVTAATFSARGGRQVGRPIQTTGVASDVFLLAASVVHGLLGLVGPVGEIEELRRQSGDAEAVREHRRGMDALARWRLGDAEQAFRAAISRDSAFTMAWYHLALSRYWRASDDPRGLAGTGPEVAGLAATALRLGEGLSERERTHVEAFYRFQQGDYVAARRAYARLVQRDSTDVFALLLQGMVEYRDPWLEEKPDGRLAPAQDLNLATRDFQETVRLSPGFYLGYGHLFDVTRLVLSTADSRAGTGFEMPRDELLPPWESGTPRNQRAFYAVYRDTLAWLTAKELGALPSKIVADGADALLERSLRQLRRWAAFAPDEPRPLHELVTWTLKQRERLPRTGARSQADSLAAEAFAYAGAAVGLERDTTSLDLLGLGNLALAAGDARGGLAWVSRALSLPGGQRSALPRWVVNVPLAVGQPTIALDAQKRVPPVTRYLPEPDSGDLFDDGGAEPVLARIEILGAVGYSGPALQAAFAELDHLWTASRYTPAQIHALRQYFLPRLGPALALAPGVRATWESSGMSSPLLAAFHAGGPPVATVAGLDEEGGGTMWGPISLYTLAVAAQEREDHRTALRLLDLLADFRLAVDSRDAGWGLGPLALYRRGLSCEALGESRCALEAYSGFLRLWTTPDPLTRDVRSRAKSAVERLSRSS